MSKGKHRKTTIMAYLHHPAPAPDQQSRKLTPAGTRSGGQAGGNPRRLPFGLGVVARLLPGLGLVAALAAAGYGLRLVPGLGLFSPMILGIVTGMAFANLLPLPAATTPGIRFAAKTLLRLAVALLGLQITLAQVASLGLAGFALAAVALFATFFATLWLGDRLGIAPPLTALIAAGSSICGASAIAAADAQIHASDEDVAYAVSCVTIFGTILMFAFPLLMPVFGLDATQYGAWSGAAIHEVAQVVGAGVQGGEEALTIAVVIKLCRVLMLAPLLVVMGLMARRFRPAEAASSGKPALVPAFLIGFVAIMLANSAGVVPVAVHDGLVGLTPVLLTLALTALGLGTNIRKLRALGPRPLVLGAAATLWISGLSLAMALLLF